MDNISDRVIGYFIVATNPWYYTAIDIITIIIVIIIIIITIFNINIITTRIITK